MGIIRTLQRMDKFLFGAGTKSKRRTSGRGYDAAKVSDLFADFGGSFGSADGELASLSRIRARSRDLCMNNPYAKHAITLIKNNVVGFNGGFGIKLSMKVKYPGAKKLDALPNRIIEKEWKKWGKKGNCTADGKLSWLGCQKLFIATVARDGEVLVRKIPMDNDFGFAIEFIECDHLEEGFNTNLANGNRIRMGIEFDKWSRPVAYHILKQHPGDGFANHPGQKRERIPASEIIHAFLTERPGQSRGVPWSHATVTRFKMLGGYEEATVVAARLGASKMGFITRDRDADEEYTGDGETEDGEIINEVKPGLIEQLPVGFGFEKFDPEQPKTNFGDFVKSILRSVGAGIGIGYNTLAGDLENVNYSSLRSGSLQERDNWQVLQGWMIESFMEEVFSGGEINWLKRAFLSGRLDPLSFSDYDRYDAATWRPRGWKWVDPSKDIKAQKEALGSQLTSRTRICNEQGIDIEDLFDELAYENELAKEKKVSLTNTESKQPQTIEVEDAEKT